MPIMHMTEILIFAQENCNLELAYSRSLSSRYRTRIRHDMPVPEDYE